MEESVAKLGTLRCKRFAMIIEDNTITSLDVADAATPECTFAKAVLAKL